MKVCITAYPYASQTGTLNVPDDCENVEEYISEHWNSIDFNSPDLDYKGTDFDFEIEEEG